MSMMICSIVVVVLVMLLLILCFFFFFSSRRRHTRCLSDWSSDVCSSDLTMGSPSPTSTYAISLPRTCRRFFWYGNAAEIMFASPVVARLSGAPHVRYHAIMPASGQYRSSDDVPPHDRFDLLNGLSWITP